MSDKPVICLAGFAAVGKSTVGKIVAKRLRLKYVSGGDALKELAVDMGYRPGGAGWWETAKGLEFLSLRARDPSFDKKVDKKLLEICRAGGVVVDSWVMPWLYKGRAFKVWLTADFKSRAERMAKRSKISVKQASRLLRSRDRKSSEIYKRLYGIRIGRDLSPFHLIVDTSGLSPNQVAEVVVQTAKHFFKAPTRRQRRRG
ncbi:MAG: cytidylate kinase family protein [Candidatus Caldarchaeum sp.]|nr:cytidylate kinase family protein [Candidatus Caldarchaeales archaeon]